MGGEFGEIAARLSGAVAAGLGWRPDDFWNATPAELAAAVQSPRDDEPLDRASIDELRRRFPDETKAG